MRWASAAMLVGLSCHAHAQTVVDLSSDRLSWSELRAVIGVISPQLRDPGSAQLKGLRRHVVDAGTVMFCGEINAKVKGGGYAGFRTFAAIPRAQAVAFEAPNEGQFETSAEVISHTCIPD